MFMTLFRVGFALTLLFSDAHADSVVVPTKPADFVDLKQIEPSILVDMMYFSTANFIGEPIAGYKANICYLTKTAALNLKKAQARLQAHAKKNNQKLSLFVRDCYRPQKAVKEFVEWTADEKRQEMKSIFYPEIAKSEILKQNYISPTSGHSRGSTVDLTIVQIDDYGNIEPLPMGTPVDFFSELSNTDNPKIIGEEHTNRQLLKTVLSPEFKNYSKEWWHYVLKTEIHPNEFFDFDIEPVPARKPQSVGLNEITTVLTQPTLLAQLDQNNSSPLSLVNILKIIHTENKLNVPAYATDARAKGDILALFKETYGAFSATITADIARIISDLGFDWEKDITQTYNPKAAKTEEGKKNRLTGDVTRVFNEKWLTSKTGQFLLSGIVNRMDRRDFTPGSCGEVRFIYRLGYETVMEGKTYASRTPFTLNMVFNYKNDGKSCQSLAAQWNLNSVVQEDPAIVAKRLVDGPINFANLVFKQMEINTQAARITSNLEKIQGRHFAGQAIYLMRIFALKNGKFAPRKLENTPDVLAILKDPAKQTQLKDYISKNIAAIDNGVYLMPESLLADVAITYSTLGSERLANKPFDLLLKPADADQLLTAAAVKDLKFALNGRGLIERLNTSTCMGCHQSSSTAGFHFLGNDRTDFGAKPADTKVALDGNRLVLPFSPHLYSELPRRAHFVAQLANSLPVNNFRPHPSAPEAEWSASQFAFKNTGDNMPCPLANESSLAPASVWACDKDRNLSCTALVTNASQSSGLGQCTPDSKHIYGGLSCRKNKIEDNTFKALTAKPDGIAFNIRSYTDRVTTDDQFYKLSEGKITANEYNCRPTRIGVPLGRSTKACTSNQLALKGMDLSTVPNEVCAIVGGSGFEEMAKGYFSSKKFAEGVNRGILNTCSPGRFCREDYICQEMPDFLTGSRFNVKPEVLKAFRDKKVGFCTPTYFVYQLRLDGHPNPL